VNQPLPKQIADQLREAEELEKAMGQPEAEAPPEPVAEVVEEPGESQEPEPTEEVTQEVEGPAVEVDVERWEAKYKTLQSKYDAEVPRLHQQNRELSTQLEALQRQMTELAASQKAEEPKQEIHRSVSEQDEETFGKDLIDLQRRIARDENAKLYDQIGA
jgi:predicted RNase H-like nuclease (RuvC/YqgF family)